MAATMNERDSHELAGELAEKLTQLTGFPFEEGYTTWRKTVVIRGKEYEDGPDIARLEFKGSTWYDVWCSIASTYNTIDALIDIDKHFKHKE